MASDEIGTECGGFTYLQKSHGFECSLESSAVLRIKTFLSLEVKFFDKSDYKNLLAVELVV